MFISMMMFVPMMLRKPLLNAKFALRMVSFEQKVADNLFYQEHLLSEPARLQRTDPSAWKVDNLRTGAEVAVNGFSLTVLNRPTNYLCVVQEKKSGQVFTVRTSNLPPADRASKAAQQNALQTLRDFLDPSRVEKLTVRIPSVASGPLLCRAREEHSRVDCWNNYLVIEYKGNAPSLALPCTTSINAPLRSPKKIIILDSNISPTESLWDTPLPRPTAVDLLRMASFPKESLHTHFKEEAISSAIKPDMVLSAITSTVLWPAMADVLDVDEEACSDHEGEECDQLYDEEFETNLVIGHYAVGEDNKPLPRAFDK